MPKPPDNGSSSFISNSSIFKKNMPSTAVLFTVTLFISVIFGIASVALVNYPELATNTNQIIVDGMLAGIIAITLPTVLTTIFIKALRRAVELNYLFFVSLFGAVVYSLFLVIGSATTIEAPLYGIAGIIVLVGDASTVAWWLFVNKVMFGRGKGGVLTALAQPTLNILTYIPVSSFLFVVSKSIQLLFLKLYIGIFIFIMVTYCILYMFDKPMERNLGFPAIEAFSKMFQGWIFDTNIASPFGPKFGSAADIEVGTLVLKDTKGKLKSIFFLPMVHYGPAGAIGGSNFPYLMERRINEKYRANAFIMHASVNEDFNPVSARQITQLNSALDICIAKARKLGGGTRYFESRANNATIKKIDIGDLGIVTFTRAPYITEDISPDSALLFNELLKGVNRKLMLVDAHNSRIEKADEDELAGVAFNSSYMKDYVNAIKRLKKPIQSGRCLVFGSSSVEAYYQLGAPEDLGHGKMNVGIFEINRSRYCIILFNANNMLPSFRKRILEHLRAKYGLNAEVYTTDTHEVNSLRNNASNVLGRHASYAKLIELVDEGVENALKDLGPVNAFYASTTMKNFMIWGRNVRERMFQVVNSVMALARILVPAALVGGFVVAAWIISIV
jgi:predicted neutral ceramidase superfamily lipid hydrolase